MNNRSVVICIGLALFPGALLLVIPYPDKLLPCILASLAGISLLVPSLLGNIKQELKVIPGMKIGGIFFLIFFILAIIFSVIKSPKNFGKVFVQWQTGPTLLTNTELPFDKFEDLRHIPKNFYEKNVPVYGFNGTGKYLHLLCIVENIGNKVITEADIKISSLSAPIKLEKNECENAGEFEVNCKIQNLRPIEKYGDQKGYAITMILPKKDEEIFLMVKIENNDDINYLGITHLIKTKNAPTMNNLYLLKTK